MTVHYIGIGGPMGSGKNYLSKKITDELETRGYKTQEIAYGYELKEEASRIMKSLRHVTDFSDVIILAGQYNMFTEEIITLHNIFQRAKKDGRDITGWSRDPDAREFLQTLGTDIRRNTNLDYWVGKIDQHIKSDTDFVVIPDVRFFNEADKVFNNQGHMFNIDIPNDVLQERLQKRDNVTYTKKSLQHISENGLSEYPHIDFIVGEYFNEKEYITDILSSDKFTQRNIHTQRK